MKKDLKTVISKVLAGTMLVTSSFAGVVTANAEDMQEVFKYDFESYSVGDEISQDSSQAIYGGPVLAGNDAKYEYKIEDDGGNKVLRLKDDKDTKNGDLAGGKVPEVFFAVPNAPITSKYVISGDIKVEKAKSAKDYVNIVNSEGTQILRLGTGKTTDGSSTAWGLRVGSNKNIAAVKATGECATLTVGSWYTYQFTVDPTAGTIEAAVKEKGAADFTVITITDVVAGGGKVIDLVGGGTNAIATGTDLSLGKLTIATGGSSDVSGVDSWHDNIALYAVAGGSTGEDEPTTPPAVDPTPTATAPAFSYDGGTNGVSISVTADGTVTASGSAVESYDAESKTLTLTADSDVTVASLIKDMIDANLDGVTVASGADGIVVTSKTDESVTISIKVVKATKDPVGEESTDPVGEESTDPAGEESTDPAGEESTDPVGEESTDPVGEESTDPAGGGSTGSDEPDTVDKTYAIDGTDAIGTDDTQELYVDTGATATKTGNGSINVSGAGKMFVKFPKAYTKGTVTFSSDVILSAGYATSSTAIFEVWGTNTAGVEQDYFGVKSNNGKYQLKNNTGAGSNVDTDVAVKTGEKVNLKLVVDLDNDVVSLYVDGVKIATDAGVVLNAGVDTLTSVDKAAYFVKAANSASQEVSNIKLNVAESTTGGDTPSSSSSTTTTTEAPVAGAVEAEKVAVGDADLANLKVGDEIDVIYKLNGVTGINNYTFYVDFNPAVLEAVGPQTVADADAVTYTLDGVGTMKLVPEDLITQQMADVPKTGDTEYDNALGGKADGVKTAAQLGRIKLAGVAGLSNSSTATTNTDGKLFVIRFKVLAGGSTNVALSPVGGAGSKTDIFYATPQSGTGADVVEISGTLPSEEITVPTTVNAPEFTYDANGVKIVITSDGSLTVTGSNVKSFDTATNTITLNSDSTVEVADLIAAVAAAGTDKATVTATATGFTVADATDATKAVTFTVVKAEGEDINPPVVGDVTVKVLGSDLKVAKGTKGLTVTTSNSKITGVETATGAIAPVPVMAANLKGITAADFVATGATVKSYDADSFTLVITIDSVDYNIELISYGDVDFNGYANVDDALALIDYGNKTATFTDKQVMAGDVDGNTFANIDDALAVIDYGNKVISVFKIFE